MTRSSGIAVGTAFLVLAATTLPPVQAQPVAASVQFGDGIAVWSIEASPSEVTIRSARPCLSVGDTDAGMTTLCLRSPRLASVRRPDGTGFRIPVRTRSSQSGWTVRLRLADVGLPEGEATARTWCREQRCEQESIPVTVPRLRIESCTARGPWLVHEAPTDVGRAVAVTFDDGPGHMTRRVLTILRREGVAATFFQIGRMLDRDPSLEGRIERGGHAIGNHSYTHPVLAGDDDRELARTSLAITRAGAPQPCLFRAPYGENPPSVVRLARARDMVTVHWNTDPGDWRGLRANEIVATTLAQARPGAIMVFHDGEPNRAMVRALPQILTSLKRRGYRFLTVPELLRLPVSYR